MAESAARPPAPVCGAPTGTFRFLCSAGSHGLAGREAGPLENDSPGAADQLSFEPDSPGSGMLAKLSSEDGSSDQEPSPGSAELGSPEELSPARKGCHPSRRRPRGRRRRRRRAPGRRPG
nr:hypothetical protein GCM10020093_040660 [Planobispora longispora]